MTEYDTAGTFNLIVKEFAKVFHIQTAFAGVNDGGGVFQHDLVGQDALHRADDIGQLAHARRLDQNAVGRKIDQHLLQCLGKVTDQGATDAPLIHFGDLDAAFLEKAGVNADLTELVFNQNDLLAGVGLLQ